MKTKGFPDHLFPGSMEKVLALLLAGMVFLTGCASTPPAPPEPTLYEWHPEGLTGETRITIDLASQIATVTIGGQKAGWAYVATGKEGYDTQPGHYRITEKIVDKHSTFYGVTEDADGTIVNGDADIRKDKPPLGGSFKFAPMPYWMRLTSYGIGMHAGHIPKPGEAASHGCIRLPKEFAPMLFERVKVGTPVTIVR